MGERMVLIVPPIRIVYFTRRGRQSERSARLN
jgi:hypothetical protein